MVKCGTHPRNGDIVYRTQKLGDMGEICSVTIPMLKETELRSFKATAATAKEAEKAAALVAIGELEASLTEMGDARKIKRHDLDMAQGKLANLILHALGGPPDKRDIVYQCQQLDDSTECTMTIPRLNYTELSEFKATAGTPSDAKKAACLLAIRDLEFSLIATGDARKARRTKKQILA